MYKLECTCTCVQESKAKRASFKSTTQQCHTPCTNTCMYKHVVAWVPQIPYVHNDMYLNIIEGSRSKVVEPKFKYGKLPEMLRNLTIYKGKCEKLQSAAASKTHYPNC